MVLHVRQTYLHFRPSIGLRHTMQIRTSQSGTMLHASLVS